MPVYECEKPQVLALIWERDGEPPVRVEVRNGRAAVVRALSMLIARRNLQPGDHLRVEAVQPHGVADWRDWARPPGR